MGHAPGAEAEAREAMIANIGSDPYEKIELLRDAGARKAKAKGVVERMKHERKIILSRIQGEKAEANAGTKISEAKLERMARADSRYETHVKGLAAAIEEEELATSEYFALKASLDFDEHCVFHASALARLER